VLELHGGRENVVEERLGSGRGEREKKKEEEEERRKGKDQG
jgi:hypothetical protein